METVADVIIDDVEACALLDSGATADLMTLAYADARNFDIRPMTELSDRFVNFKLAALSGYVDYNLQIPGISSYHSDPVALVAEDDTPFSREVPLTIGTKTEDTILKALKEGEMEMLDSIWKRVKNNRSLSKLQEEVGVREAMVQVAWATGQEPLKFKDHTPYLNQGMEDLLKLNELASAIKTEIILPQSNKTIKARTPLVLMGTSMNAMTEPLHLTDEALPQGCMYILTMAHTIVAVGGQQFSSIILRTTPLLSRKELPLLELWQPMRFLRWWWQMVHLEPFKLKDGPRKVMPNSPSRREEKSFFEKLELSGLKSWTEENKERTLNPLAEYHDIFALEDGEMGCTEATEHKIEVTDQKPFKERLRNIPSGLLEELKDHLDHMLDVGVIKPGKSAWSNAVVLVWKKDRGLRFCMDFRRLNTRTQKDAFPLPRIHDAINALSGSKY